MTTPLDQDIEALRAELGVSQDVASPLSHRIYKTEGERRVALRLLRLLEWQAYGEPRTPIPASHHA